MQSLACCMSSKVPTSDPEATKAALDPPKQERIMNRGCLFGSIRYSIAGSLTARRASSAETQLGVSSAQCIFSIQSHALLHVHLLSGS